MATSASDFDLRDLRKKKISVYLGIKPRDFERLQIVMNVFFQQAIGEQTAELPENNPLLKYQLLVVLDEFTAVGRIPILLTSIAFVPGYNVRTLMVIQTPSQLDEVYGQNGRKIMLKTLAARIIFPPNDMEDARNVSEELGYTTVKSRSRTVPGRHGRRQAQSQYQCERSAPRLDAAAGDQGDAGGSATAVRRTRAAGEVSQNQVFRRSDFQEAAVATARGQEAGRVDL